jgi:hypothetical protein
MHNAGGLSLDPHSCRRLNQTGALAGAIVYRDETVMTHAHAAIDAASIAKLIGRQG